MTHEKNLIRPTFLLDHPIMLMEGMYIVHWVYTGDVHCTQGVYTVHRGCTLYTGDVHCTQEDVHCKVDVHMGCSLQVHSGPIGIMAITQKS